MKRSDLRPRPPWKCSEEERACTGTGRCHGPLAWCVFCGDVTKVCDDSRCDGHVRDERGAVLGRPADVEDAAEQQRKREEG